MGSTFQADIPGNKHVAVIGTSAAVASNGADARLAGPIMIAHQNLKVLSLEKQCHAAEVTKGTATTSASYRRSILYNGGSSGTGTVNVASANATASVAAQGTRAFATTATNTVADGEVLYVSHLSVGAATANGTDMAAATYVLSYELL